MCSKCSKSRYEQTGGSPSIAAFFEEGAEESSGFVLQNPTLVGVGVVQARVSGEIVEGAGSTSLGILGGVDEAANTGGVERAGAHGAGFEGCIEGTLSESPATEFACGATQGEELGVGRWVTECLTLVVGHR